MGYSTALLRGTKSRSGAYWATSPALTLSQLRESYRTRNPIVKSLGRLIVGAVGQTPVV